MNVVRSVVDGASEEAIAEIETLLSNGLPTFQIIGFTGKSLDEAKDRVRSAITSSSLQFPRKKITTNISPSDLSKNGSHYDLGIAISVLLAASQIKIATDDVLFFGELSLDGDVKTVRGILGKILFAKQAGFHRFVIPEGNLTQALAVPDIEVLPVSSLKQLCNLFQSNDAQFINSNKGNIPIKKVSSFVDLSEIIGQEAAKRALEIAAAGNHNLLLSGPPGVGKSMLAKALIGILPPMERDESLSSRTCTVW